MILHPQTELYHLKPQTLKRIEIVITVIRHPQLNLYRLKPQPLKHVEIIEISVKPTSDTSVERV